MIKMIKKTGSGIFLCMGLWASIVNNGTAQNFPPVNITIYDSVATQGYYFMAPYRSVPPYTYTHPLLILDRLGRIVFYRVFPGAGINITTSEDFKIQTDGRMTYFSRVLNYFCIMDSTFLVIDSANITNGFAIDMHDLQFLPNGHYLMLAKESRYMNLTGYHWFGFNHTAPGSPDAEVIGVVIQEYDANKNLVWEWKGHDHFDFSDVDSVWLFSPSKVDWTHANAVEQDNDGNILLCTRHFNEITKINRQTGNIIWRFGGKRNQFTFTNDPLQFNGQHDIRRLSNGHITIFDNGMYHDPPMARALEYSLNETSKTATLVWEYIFDSSMYSSALGNFQVLENDNRLIDFGACPGNYPWMVVVKPDKSMIIEISSPNDYTSYRAFNYDTLPWSFPRPGVDCHESGGTFYLEAEEGHSSYKWSTGATTRAIPVINTGEYWVFVPLGNGFISSERIVVYDSTNPCLYLGTGSERTVSTVHLHCDPNPVSKEAWITFDLPAPCQASLTLTGLNGITVFSIPSATYLAGHHRKRLDASAIPRGIYFLHLRAGDHSVVQKLIVL
jgi:hypothetical protein